MLITERLVLRGHEPADLDDVAAMWGDTAVTRYIGFTRSRQDAWFTMARYRGFWSLLGYGYWIVRERRTERFVGEVGFGDFKRGLDPDLSGMPEAGWVFAQSAWGQGFASEATCAIHDWLDRQGQAASSVCVIDPENTASVRIAEKIGYRRCRTTMMAGVAVDIFSRLKS